MRVFGDIAERQEEERISADGKVRAIEMRLHLLEKPDPVKVKYRKPTTKKGLPADEEMKRFKEVE